MEIDILSVLVDKLLVAHKLGRHLFVYDQQGYHIRTITIDKDVLVLLKDAVWTPYGNILYISLNKVVLISEAGKHITQTEIIEPDKLSVSSDEIIYVTANDKPTSSVFQSSNGGVTWSMVFKSATWEFHHVIKVSADQGDEFWTYAFKNKDNTLRILVQSVDRVGIDDTGTSWKEFNVGTSVTRLSHDGNGNIYFIGMIAKTVYVMQRNGTRPRSLLSLDNFVWSMDVEIKSNLLCVGHNNRKISIYRLLYS